MKRKMGFVIVKLNYEEVRKELKHKVIEELIVVSENIQHEKVMCVCRVFEEMGKQLAQK